MMMKARMGPSTQRKRLTQLALLCTHLSLGSLALTTVGCRITNDDVHAWAKKVSGPRKLIAVLQHDKYATKLRVQAALTLVTMPPRGGHAVGLLGDEDALGLLVGLKEMNESERGLIIAGLVPYLEKGMLAPVEDGGPDESFPYKDAAYLLLTYGESGLVSNPKDQDRLKKALVGWTQHNFIARMDDTTQLSGMEQVLRYLRADGVRGLTPLIDVDFKKLRQIATLIKELGDEPTKLDASVRMVKIALFVDSDAWIKKKTPAVQEANKASGLTVTPQQLEKQLRAFQGEELQRVFGAMKSVGQKPIVDYFLAYAKKPQNPEERRAAALAALEGQLDRKNPAHATAMLDLLSSDETPDRVRDIAARRIGELSRDQVATRLFSLFDHDRWQLRWTVASLVLKLSNKSQIDEFMQRIGKVKHMAISEPFSYGKLVGEVPGVAMNDLITEYTRSKYPAPVRLSALGYYYGAGKANELAKVQPFFKDSQKVPSCPKDAEQCAWECTVTGQGKTPKSETKTIKTVGEFVEYCVAPAMSARKETNKRPKNTPASDGVEKK